MAMKKTVLAAALFTLAGVAQSAPITSLEITGGTFVMGPSTPHTLIPGAHANMSVDGVTFDGVPGDDAATSIVTFIFGFVGPVGVYTAAAAYDGVFGATPVTGDLTGSNLTLDLNSWTIFWGGWTHNQGATGVTATVDGAGNFSASWDADVIGGPFDGQISHWNITGVAASGGTTNPVPVPATVWLFGSGLLGLAGVARFSL